jgi:hypothetical protein
MLLKTLLIAKAVKAAQGACFADVHKRLTRIETPKDVQKCYS